MIYCTFLFQVIGSNLVLLRIKLIIPNSKTCPLASVYLLPGPWRTATKDRTDVKNLTTNVLSLSNDF